jgi:hypothetical protein
MKRQIAKVVSIVGLFVILSAGAGRVSAGSCANPSCLHPAAVTATARTQTTNTKPRAASAQAGEPASFAFFLVTWTISCLHLV